MAFVHDTDLNTCLHSFGLFSDYRDEEDSLQGVRGEPITELLFLIRIHFCFI